MRRCFYRLLLVFLILGAHSVAASAAPDETAASVMAQFQQDYDLREENFAICYYNTVTGEEYRWNDARFMPAASTFKLPLNLYYYELAQSGEIAPDASIGGVTLSECHYQSLVWSNNELSLAMLYNLGNFRTYKNLMLRYFTMPEETIAPEYYYDNNYCAGMMLDALKYLYIRREQFPEMLDYLKQAQPDSYFKRYVTDYEIAHKYGYFEDVAHDVGIIYTPQPFALAVYTQNLPDGENVLARACEVLTDYTVRQYEATLPTPEPAPTPELTPEPAPPNSTAPAPALAPETPPAPSAEQAANDNLWWMILVAATLFLIGDLAVLLAMKKGSPAQFWKRYEKKRK